MTVALLNDPFLEFFWPFSDSVGSLNIIFSQIMEDGTVELVSRFVENFFENFPILVESSSTCAELLGDAAETAHGNWLSFKEFKKESIDPHQATISRALILSNFGWGWYKARQLKQERSLLREKLELGDFSPAERVFVIQTYQNLRRQGILCALPIIQLPSLFFEIPGAHPWQTTAHLIQRSVAASFNLKDPQKSSTEKISQAVLDGIALTGSSLLLAKQLEVIAPDDPTTNYVILATASVGYLHLTYQCGVNVSNYLISCLSGISSAAAAVSHGV